MAAAVAGLDVGQGINAAMRAPNFMEACPPVPT